MRSIEFNGHDFSAYTTAEVLAAGALAVEADAAVVPGRPGAALLGGRILPREVRVRLFMDIDADADADAAGARAAVRSWLEGVEGAGEALLCGSGSSTFAVCDDFATACAVAAKAQAQGWWARATTFSSARASVIPDKR